MFDPIQSHDDNYCVLDELNEPPEDKLVQETCSQCLKRDPWRDCIYGKKMATVVNLDNIA